MKTFIKRRLGWIGLCLFVVMMATLIGINIDVEKNASNQPEVVFTIGNEVYASGSPDYICDGIADDVQFQGAMNALPAVGGKLVILSGTYNLTASVTRLIDNVTIEGMGRGTYITYNAANPVFIMGGNNWVMQDIRTDAGGITVGATTGWIWRNVTVNATTYSLRTETTVGSVTSGDITGTDITGSSVTDSGLTSGRVPIAGVGGLLGDDSDLTFSGDTLSVTALDAPTGRGATYVMVTDAMTGTWAGQYDEIATGTSMETVINTALAALNATGNHEKLLLVGDFACDGTVNAVSNVDVQCIGSITVTIAGAGNGLYFNNITNSTWTDVVVYRAGAVGAAAANAILLYGNSTDSTCKLIRCKGINQCTGTYGASDEGGLWGITIGMLTSASPYLEDCLGQGSASATSGVLHAGIDIHDCIDLSTNTIGTATLVRCKGIGGAGGGTIQSPGYDITEPYNGTMIDCEGIAVEGKFGIHINESNPTLINCKATAGAYANGAGFWIQCGATPILRNCEGISGTGAATTAILIEDQSAPIIEGGFYHPPMERYKWSYDDANSGRFAPYLDAAWYLYDISIWVVNVNAGVTISFGTTPGGNDIANAVSIATAGQVNFTFTNKSIVSGAYLYATTSAGITDGDVYVYYEAVKAITTQVTCKISTSRAARFNGVHFLSAGNAITSFGVSFYIDGNAVSAPLWRADNCNFEGLSSTTVNSKTVYCTAAMANVPIYNSTVHARGPYSYVTNITSFADNSNAVGTTDYAFKQIESEHFQDVLAASATYIRNGENLNVAAPLTFTIDAQPDVPRTLTWAWTGHTDVTTYTITFTGTDAKGRTVTDVITQASGWSGETSNAYAIVAISMTVKTGAGNADNIMNVGIGSKIGLCHHIPAAAALFKAKQNNADLVLTKAVAEATYDTVNFAAGGGSITGADDITVWYKY